MRSIEGVSPAGAPETRAKGQTAGFELRRSGRRPWRTGERIDGDGLDPAARMARARAASCSKASAAGLVVSLVLALAVFIVDQRRRGDRDAATRTARCCLEDDAGDDGRRRRSCSPTCAWTSPASSRASRVDAALRQPDRRMARGRLRVPAAREGGRRSPAHADRRARDRGHDQGARRGAAHLRQREAAKARKATLVEQERPNMFTTSVAQHRAARRDRRRHRVPADAALRRGHVPRCASRWRSRRATSRARRRTGVGTGWARATDASRRRSHHAAGRRAAATATCCRCTLDDRPRRRLPAVATLSSTYHAVTIERARRPPLSPHARRRAGAGGARLRARVDAGRRRRARRRAVHRDARAARRTRC